MQLVKAPLLRDPVGFYGLCLAFSLVLLGFLLSFRFLKVYRNLSKLGTAPPFDLQGHFEALSKTFRAWMR